MTVHIHIEALSGAEVRRQMIALLGDIALSPSLTAEEQARLIADGLGAVVAAPAEAADAEPEKPKTRGQRTSKKTTVADLPAEVVAEAEAAGVHVEDESRIPVEEQKLVEEYDERNATDGVEAQEQVEEPTAYTENDVRNLIIDFLNEMQAAHPDDPDIRTKTLKPLLDELGAQKISLIPMTRYADVPALLSSARTARAGGAK